VWQVWQEGPHGNRMPVGKLELHSDVMQWSAVMKGCPVPQRMRLLSPLHKGYLDAAIGKWLAQGIIEPSNAWITYNPVFVPRKSGAIRVCIDYSPLNGWIEDFEWPLPRLRTIRFRVRGSTRFSRIDLRDAFHIIRIPQVYRSLTAFISHVGKFQFTRMPFGLKTAPAVFQRFMDYALRDCYQFAIWYQDDILIHSTDKVHNRCLTKVRDALRAVGAPVNEDKSEYNKEELDFAGLHISSEGVGTALDQSQLDIWPIPTTVKGWQSILGFLNCFRDYVPRFSDLAAGLYPTPQKVRPQLELEKQVRELMSRCLRHVNLSHFEETLPSTLFADASNYATGAVLSQAGKIIALHSKTLTPAETRYSTTDRESLALLHAAEAFRVIIQGAPLLELATDHSALLSRRTEDLTPRQERWRYRIQSIVRTVRFVKGVENPADYWSREGSMALGMGSKLIVKVRSSTPRLGTPSQGTKTRR
jgi:Reverse transcriptase (RNA-dependent DNA polymerase)/RNase H-like domain found in reverse transcriptase